MGLCERNLRRYQHIHTYSPRHASRSTISRRSSRTPCRSLCVCAAPHTYIHTHCTTTYTRAHTRIRMHKHKLLTRTHSHSRKCYTHYVRLLHYPQHTHACIRTYISWTLGCQHGRLYVCVYVCGGGGGGGGGGHVSSGSGLSVNLLARPCPPACLSACLSLCI